MIQNVLQHIGGVANYGILSLCLFFAAFLGLLIWAFRLKRPDLDAAAALPLVEDTNPAAKPESRHD